MRPGFQTVLGANRNKGGLVLGQQELLAVDRHLTGAGENDPVLGAVVVHLHREGAARFHGDAVDVEARGLDHHVAAAPGTVNLAVALVLAALVLLRNSTAFFTSWERSRFITSTASLVLTITGFSTPMAATSFSSLLM